jgi:hypothetical protein
MRRKNASTRRGVAFLNTQWLRVISVKPTTSPMSGAITMKISVFVQPETMMAAKPALATAEPA